MVSVVAGAGEVGASIVADERVACVAFTGSVETGKRIAQVCAERVARVNLEMGGKDPFIVCADVAEKIGVAARGGAWAAFLNAGQVCTSAERFYVAHEVYDDYLSEFVDYTKSLRVGDPLDPDTDVGPMVSATQRAKVAAQVEAAVAAGAEVITGGDTAGNSKGHFFSPTVVTGAAAETDLLSEETFGPVAPLVPVGSLDEAIELANSTRFGLGANVYTGDLKTMVRCMREIKAGTVWFNDPLTDNDAGPFGGFKQSGLGRELGREGLEAFQETKHVHIETEIEAKDWWYPYGAATNRRRRGRARSPRLTRCRLTHPSGQPPAGLWPSRRLPERPARVTICPWRLKPSGQRARCTTTSAVAGSKPPAKRRSTTSTRRPVSSSRGCRSPTPPTSTPPCRLPAQRNPSGARWRRKSAPVP